MCVCLSWVFSLHMGSLSSYFLLCILSSLGLKEVSVLFLTLCLLFPYFTSPFYSLGSCSSLLLTLLLLLLLPGFHTSLCWMTCLCFYVCLIFLFVGPNWKRALNLIWAFTPTMWPVIVVGKCYNDLGKGCVEKAGQSGSSSGVEEGLGCLWREPKGKPGGVQEYVPWKMTWGLT